MIERSPAIILLFSFVTALVLSSCETEVDLLAPYEETPVIYGILDYTADTQFVRINKTFLGEGDPNQYSVIRDSVEYDLADVEAAIFKYNANGTFLDSIPLKPIVIPSREPGIFYNQDVLFYYTDENLFTETEFEDPEDIIFELNTTLKGEKYIAETRFPGLSNTTIESPVLPGLSGPQKMQFVLNNGTFSSFPFKYNTDAFSASYAASLRINFDYLTSDGTLVEDRFIDYELGNFDNADLDAGEDVTISLFGENWFTFLGNQLDLIPDLADVQITDLNFRVTGSTPELNTYLEVVQPVSQFTPVLSTFTNISNGAIGIFASVATQSRIAHLSESTLAKFNNSPITNSYNFCVQGWSGSGFLCTE